MTDQELYTREMEVNVKRAEHRLHRALMEKECRETERKLNDRRTELDLKELQIEIQEAELRLQQEIARSHVQDRSGSDVSQK